MNCKNARPSSSSTETSERPSELKVVNIGIDTHQEPIVYMRNDCHICLSEGFSANSRVLLRLGSYRDCGTGATEGHNTEVKSLIATLNVVQPFVLETGAAGLSQIALQRLGAQQGDVVRITHAPVVTSLSSVRKKVFGHKLSRAELAHIIKDISTHRYSDIEIASFLSVCAGSRLDVDEIISLTQAMVACGKRLEWPGHAVILDKHCIGGIPGNRTTPLVVSIVSAAGLVIPKTSSRAITSPAGTADAMETLTTVRLELEEIQRVVKTTHACLAWGGAVNLSPADDLLIRIEQALDLDGEGQLIASVLSKKIAAGSTHAVIDIPVGPTAKVRDSVAAERLASLFTQVGAACGICVRCVISDGQQPVGFGVGPVEEARDVLSVLQCSEQAPKDLRDRALALAAELFCVAQGISHEEALLKATALLDEGKAWQQFQRIVQAQGGMKALPTAKYQHTEGAPVVGTLTAIDNRQLARLAKLTGAPGTPTAGVRLHAKVGSVLAVGDPLFTLYSESQGQRDYGLSFYHEQASPFTFE